MRQAFNFFKKYYKHDIRIFLYIVCSLFAKLCMLLIPYLTKILIDQIQFQNLDKFKFISGILVLTMILFSIFLSSKYYLQNYVEVRILNLLKKDMIMKILRIKNAKMESITTGEVIQKIFSDTDVVRPLVISTYVDCIINIMYATAIISIMFIMNKIITIILILLFPIFIVFYKIYVPNIERTNKKIINADENIKSLTEEVLNGCLDIKINNAKGFIKRKLAIKFNNYFKFNLDKTRYIMQYDYVLVTGIMNLATLLIYCFGGYLVFKSLISIGTLISFTLYFSKLWDPVEYFMELSKELKIQLISLNRIKGFLGIDEEIQTSNTILPNFKELIIKNLKFSYDERTIFDDLNLNVQCGEIIGIKGENGAGKSTFANLIIKLLDGYEGEIYYNDFNYKSVDSQSIRSKIRYIPAKTFLFNGSIIENITLDDNATKDDIKKFIEKSNTKELFTVLEKNGRGLDVVVNNQSNNLSGGEQKIIQILRGLFLDGEIFILDEPFNYIDKNHKQILIDFIKNNLKSKTLIIISHDEEIFKYCNKVYQLQQKVIRIK